MGDHRGRYEQITYTDRDGNVWPAALFGPHDTDGGPYPGVLLVCHACFPLPLTTENVALWYWAAETLAEAGYVVMYAAVGGNNVPRTIDATDFLTATPTSPTPRSGDFNPWYEQVDRNRLGIVGHSGAAGVALNVGNSDPRYDAIVAWDPASFRVPERCDAPDPDDDPGRGLHPPRRTVPRRQAGRTPNPSTPSSTPSALPVSMSCRSRRAQRPTSTGRASQAESLRRDARPRRVRRDGRRVLHGGVARSVRRRPRAAPRLDLRSPRVHRKRPHDASRQAEPIASTGPLIGTRSAPASSTRARS